ncbi:MAG: hypothetical protein ACTS5G_04030, partial [Burkholderiales bacterium]
MSATQLNVDELEFLLNESGQRLVLADLDVRYRVNSFTSAPQVNAVAIGSAELLAPGNVLFTGTGEAAEEGDDAEAPGMLLSELITLLREFPLASVTVDALTIPQRSVPIAFALQRGDGRLNAELESGALRLQATFSQADAAADAQLAVTLTRADASVGNFELVLSPMGAVYALTGAGDINVADVNALLGELEQASTGLPLRAAQLSWNLAGEVTNDLRGNAAAGDVRTFALGFDAGSTVTLREELVSGLGALTIAFTDSAALTVSSGAGLTVSSSGLPLEVTGSWNEQAANIEAQLRFADCELSAATICSIGFDGEAGWAEYSLAGNIAANLQGAGQYHLATQDLVLTGLPEW